MGIRSASTSRKNDSTSALYRLLSSSIFDMWIISSLCR
jgi:hypothetical protein